VNHLKRNYFFINMDDGYITVSICTLYITLLNDPTIFYCTLFTLQCIIIQHSTAFYLETKFFYDSISSKCDLSLSLPEFEPRCQLRAKDVTVISQLIICYNVRALSKVKCSIQYKWIITRPAQHWNSNEAPTTLKATHNTL